MARPAPKNSKNDRKFADKINHKRGVRGGEGGPSRQAEGASERAPRDRKKGNKSRPTWGILLRFNYGGMRVREKGARDPTVPFEFISVY